MRARHYVLHLWGDIEPQVHGPFSNDQDRDEKAKQVRREDDSEGGIFRVEIDEAGELQVDAYSGAFFEDEAAGCPS